MSQSRFNLIWIIVFTLTLPCAVVFSTQIARKSFEKVKFRSQTIRVKGYAEQPIESDLAKWAARIVIRDMDRTQAHEKLVRQRMTLMAYLDESGFPAQLILKSPVEISLVYKRDSKGNQTAEIHGYVISQHFSLKSRDVQKVKMVADNADALISAGIELDAESPEYLYTRLDEMKLEMLARATTNARQRAEKLISSSSNVLGPLRSASQGVFQITPAFSTDVSNYGYNDTSSRDKVIKAVVTLEYGIE